jgi:divalent metal cation (Fe/Co/Zn/Cd) transporter
VQSAVGAIAQNADVVVHAVPLAENEGVIERIVAIAANGHYSVHNITTHSTSSGTWVDLDLEVDPELSFRLAHALATDLETSLRKDLTDTRRVADVNVHIEPRDQILAKGVDFSSHETREYVEWIESTQREIAHTRGVQDIALQKLNGKIYLSCHLLIDADRSISQVHTIAEEMENRLRRELPQLGRVVIHTEPYEGKK